MTLWQDVFAALGLYAETRTRSRSGRRRSACGWRSTDPVTLAAVAMVLLCVSIVACVRPAYRATRLDPVTALRYD